MDNFRSCSTWGAVGSSSVSLGDPPGYGVLPGVGRQFEDAGGGLALFSAEALPPTSTTSPQAALAPPLPVRGSGAGMHMPPAFEGGAHGVVPLGTLAYLHAGACRVMQLCISLGLAYRIVIFIQVLTLNNIYSIG